jgi:oligopeptide/dipeptide ABC transporter ATP-binding protein
LQSVGIPDPERRLKMYPHQFSGGMRQRIMMAIALAAQPRILIADEPTTALDVTTQAQILDLMHTRTKEMGTSTLLITHDMGVVARYAQRVNVMYSGLIVEHAPVRELFASAAHPYTRGLLLSMPRLDRPRVARLPAIEGLPPVVTERPKGCPFQSRCQFRVTRCEQRPPLVEMSQGHSVACWRADDVVAIQENDWLEKSLAQQVMQ